MKLELVCIKHCTFVTPVGNGDLTLVRKETDVTMDLPASAYALDWSTLSCRDGGVSNPECLVWVCSTIIKIHNDTEERVVWRRPDVSTT